MNNSVFNTAYVAHVFNERGYRVNEFAARLDLSNNIIEGFLRGTVEPGELRIGTLVNMANLLGIPLHSLFARPEVPDPDETHDADTATPEVAADAEQLIATTYDNGRITPILVADIAKAFDWTTDRTYDAATEADRRLTPAGLRAITSHGEFFIAPINDHLPATKALAERKVYERGLSHTHYKAAHQVLTGQPVTVTNSGRQRLRTLGGLVNLGILTQANNPEFTDAAREAFL